MSEALELEETDDEIVLIEDTEDVGDIEDIEEADLQETTEEVEETQEEPQEKPKKIPRSQKRIHQLIDKNKDLEAQLQDLKDKFSELSMAERKRSSKEVENETNRKFQDISEKQRQAYEEGDYEAVQKYNLELMQLNQGTSAYNDDLDDPSKKTEYFKSANPWYDNEELDPGKIKSRYARGLSVELMNDKKYSGWSNKEILDEVARQTNLNFRKNHLKKTAPTAGVTNTPAGSQREIRVSAEDFEVAKKMYPHLRHDRQALKKKIIETLK